MIYRTIQLYDLVVRNKISKQLVLKLLTDFSCPLNKDVEAFLHKKAYDFERVGMSRTYLVYAQKHKEDALKLCGFYSLSPH